MRRLASFFSATITGERGAALVALLTALRRLDMSKKTKCIYCDEPRVAKTSWCREHKKAYHREWRQKNLERRRKAEIAYDLNKFYGITVEVYNQILESQGGVCAICEATPGRRRLNVDHCHSTNIIRGLLCDSCNLMLGKANDRPEILRLGAEYIEHQWCWKEALEEWETSGEAKEE